MLREAGGDRTDVIQAGAESWCTASSASGAILAWERERAAAWCEQLCLELPTSGTTLLLGTEARS